MTHPLTHILLSPPTPQVLNGSSTEALLSAVDPSDPSGPGLPALYPLFWRVGGEQCAIGWNNAFGQQPQGSQGDQGGADKNSSSNGGGSAGGIRPDGGAMGREWYGRLPGTVRALLHSLVSRGSSMSQHKPYPSATPSSLMWPPRGVGAAAAPLQGGSGGGRGATAAGWTWRLLPSPDPSGIIDRAEAADAAGDVGPPSALMGSPSALAVSARSMPPPRPDPPSSAPPPPDPPPPPPSADAWAYQGVSCSLALLGGGAEGPSEVGGGRMRIAAAAAGVWWELRCGLVDGQGRPINETAGGDGGGGGGEGEGGAPRASCGEAVRGPRAVVVVDKVQTGFLGATLSSFGITGEEW